MRIHNIIKTVCLAGSLALLSACEDWLEIEPKDRFGDTTVWGSEENADMFLNDIYNQLPHLNNETQNLDQYSDNSYVGAEWMNALQRFIPEHYLLPVDTRPLGYVEMGTSEQ